MKKIRILSFVCALLMIAASFTACKKSGKDGDFDESGAYKPSNDTTVVRFWGWGDDVESSVFETITNTFNETVGKQYNIKVDYRRQPSSGYSTNTELSLAGYNTPDVVYVEDKYLKSWAEAGYLAQLDIKQNGNYVYPGFDFENTENTIWNNAIMRYRYNTTSTTSNTSDPLWALPKDIGPTALYYNSDYLKQLGITEISVPEAELSAYNAEHGTSYSVKGYDAAKKVFNNRIAMNWEETIQLAKEMQKLEGCDYGYYNEWWFNYGWSVGGDVVEYVTDENGSYYKFTLNDESANYIVKDDESAITVNGNTYRAGEIISYTDKEKLTEADKAKCNVLPSMKDAFLEFVALTSKDGYEVGTKSNGEKQLGYGVSMGAESLGTSSAKDYFVSGRFGMYVNIRADVTYLRNHMKSGSWNVAPLPVYKEYDSQGNVAVHGIPAGHSGSVGLAIAEGSTKKNAAWMFLKYVAGEEGQTSQSLAGFAIPNQVSLANSDVFLQSDKDPINSIVFVEAAAYQRPGDWWTLKDSKWIDDWAQYLNFTVRENKATVDDMFRNYYDATQTKLYAYTGYKK